MHSHTHAQSLPGIDALMWASIDLFKKKWRFLIGLTLMPLVFGAVFGALVIFGMYVPVPPVVALVVFGVMFLAAIILWMWVYTAVFVALLNTSMGFSDVMKKSWTLMLPVGWVALLVTLIVWGGFLLLIIPGFIFGLWALPAMLITIEGTARGMEAFLKGRTYVQGRTWSVLGKVLGMILFPMLVVIPVGVVLGAIEEAFKTSPYVFIVVIVQFVLQTLMGAYVMCYTVSLYTALRDTAAHVPHEAYMRGRGKYIALALVGVVAFVMYFVVIGYLIATAPSEESSRVPDATSDDSGNAYVPGEIPNASEASESGAQDYPVSE